MADRAQNITINYKFNTAEIEKANAILNRANTATNTLQAAGQKAGQQISTSYGQAGKSIEAMNIQLARLKTQISVSSDPKRVADLSNQYKILKAQIDAANKSAFQTPKAMKETAVATQSLASQFGQLYTAAKLIITAGIIKEVVDIGLAMADLKGNVEGVERAFARAFPNELNLLSKLREATHGAVTDFELMQRTLQATNLGVAVEQLPILFEFAAARAQQTGESVDYLVDSIVRGIGRKSILVLDNLGLSATRLKEQFGGAALASQSVADVTKGVAEIARQELAKMGGYLETDKTKADQLRVAFEELRITLAKKIEGGGFLSFVTNRLNDLQQLLKGQKQVLTEQLQAIGASDAANIKESESYKKLGDDRQKQFDFIQQEINTRVELIGQANDNIKTLEEEREILRDQNPYDKKIESTNKVIGSIKEHKFILASIILALKDYLKELDTVTKKESEPSGIIERKKAEIEAIQQAIEKTNNLNDLGVGGKLVKSLEIAQAELADLQRAFSDINPKPFEFKIDEATEAINKFIKAGNNIAAGQLEGRIQEAMDNLANTQFTPPPVAGFLPDSFWTELGAEFEENWTDILSQGVDIQANFLSDVAQTELDSYKQRLVTLRNFYDEQQILAGDNERAKTQLKLREERETNALQRKIFEKEKQTRRAQALIDGAAGVVKAFATYPYPAAIVISALIAAQTAANINIINRQRSGYAKGVINLKGPGTGTSDSIPANLSRGESVMTAWETRHAGDVLKDVRAKKLDNKVLNGLKQGREPIHTQQQFNDEKIIKAIEKNRPPDVVEQSGIVYKITKQTDTYRNKVRAKSVRL